MKKMVQVLLYSLLAMSSTYAHTNKTFLMPRPQGVNLAMESTAGWYELIHRAAPERFGGHAQAIFFFQDSTDDCKMGRYFGIKEHNKVSLGAVSIAGTGGDPTRLVTEQDFDILYMIHTPANNITTPVTAPHIPANAASVKFSPEQTVYGAYLNYYQNLDTLVKGLYLNVVLPVVRVKNETNLIVLGERSETVQNFFAGKYKVDQVLDATTKNPTIANAQDPLQYGLITGNRTIQTGVADIDIIIGYTCWDKEYAHASLNMGMTIPTGNEPKGKYLFEAVLGNGAHYGFGAGGDLWARLCGNFEHNIKILFKANYRYLFGATETRTVGLKSRDWGQYTLLGSTLPGEKDRAIPAANILTRKVEVTPGNQLDLISGISYNNGGFSIDLGYNFYFREQEAVTLKGCLDSAVYGVLARNHSFRTADGGTSGNFTGVAGQLDKGDKGATTLTTDDLDVIAAETPRQMTHKVYAGGSFRIDTWDIPVLMGLGGHAEFAERNSVFDTWGIHGKVAVKF